MEFLVVMTVCRMSDLVTNEQSFTETVTVQPGEKTLDVINWVYGRIGISRPDLRGGVIRFAAVFPAVLVPETES